MITDIALGLHVAFGSIALACFWASALLRKGSRRHRRTGSLYFAALAVVVVTAAPLTARAFLDHDYVLGGFLTSLILITLTSGWNAWRAVRDRNAPGRFFGRPYHALAAANVVAGTTMLLVGVMQRIPIVAVFSAVGIALGATMFARASRRHTRGTWSSLEAHYSNVVGCGVATHIAFLNLGLTRWLPEVLQQWTQPMAWFVPLAGAFVATRWLDARYSRRTAASRSATTADGPA